MDGRRTIVAGRSGSWHGLLAAENSLDEFGHCVRMGGLGMVVVKLGDVGILGPVRQSDVPMKLGVGASIKMEGHGSGEQWELWSYGELEDSCS